MNQRLAKWKSSMAVMRKMRREQDQSESLADISRISKPMQDSTTDIIEGLVEKAVSEVDPSYSESNI